MTAFPNVPTPLAAPDESLIWVADLIASLDLPVTDLEATGAESDPELDLDDIGTVDATAEEIAQTSQDLNLPAFDYDAEDDGSLLNAFFGWLGDLLASLFGGGSETDDMATDPDLPPDPIPDGPGPLLFPADVSADTVMTAVEPDQEYLDQLEEELAALELL